MKIKLDKYNYIMAVLAALVWLISIAYTGIASALFTIRAVVFGVPSLILFLASLFPSRRNIKIALLAVSIILFIFLLIELKTTVVVVY